MRSSPTYKLEKALQEADKQREAVSNMAKAMAAAKEEAGSNMAKAIKAMAAAKQEVLDMAKAMAVAKEESTNRIGDLKAMVALAQQRVATLEVQVYYVVSLKVIGVWALGFGLRGFGEMVRLGGCELELRVV